MANIFSLTKPRISESIKNLDVYLLLALLAINKIKFAFSNIIIELLKVIVKINNYYWTFSTITDVDTIVIRFGGT
jgi:hypothetical protein